MHVDDGTPPERGYDRRGADDADNVMTKSETFRDDDDDDVDSKLFDRKYRDALWWKLVSSGPSRPVIRL